MLFDVTAKQYGHSMKFQIEVQQNPKDDEMNVYKDALKMAKDKARIIFDFKVGAEDPTVSVKPSKEQGVE